ncbi:unnamed protein product, partial [Ectocarpus sp. 4 AP-2014]
AVSNEVLLPGFPTLVDTAEDDEAVEARAWPGEAKVTVSRGQPGNGTLTGAESDADAPPGSVEVGVPSTPPRGDTASEIGCVTGDAHPPGQARRRVVRRSP